jgi:hypothetical protein
MVICFTYSFVRHPISQEKTARPDMRDGRLQATFRRVASPL